MNIFYLNKFRFQFFIFNCKYVMNHIYIYDDDDYDDDIQFNKH